MDLPNTKQRAYLKTRFAYGEIPTQQDFADLIEAGTNQLDDGLAKAGSGPLCIQAGSDPNQPDQPVLSLFSNFKDPSPLCVLRLNPSADPKDATSARPGLGIGDARGMTRLFLDAQTGNVGIGTVAPKAALHVVGVGLVIGNVGIGTVEPKAALHVEGVGLVSDGDGYAVPQGYMAKGSLTIGSITSSFGGMSTPWIPGKSRNTAGLLLETKLNTEIAIHHSGIRVVSAIYYDGAENSLTIGRKMGWDAIGLVRIAGQVTSRLQLQTEPDANQKRGTAEIACDQAGRLVLRVADGGTSAGMLDAISILSSTGNVGIGTALHVAGDLRVDGKINAKGEDWMRVEAYGKHWKPFPAVAEHNDGVFYFKDALGIVHICGCVIASYGDGPPQGENLMFSLPAGYRPDHSTWFVILMPGASDKIWHVEVQTDGSVYTNAGTTIGRVSLGGITFRAASS